MKLKSLAKTLTLLLSITACSDDLANLPEIGTFLNARSDRFIVDINTDIVAGHPFKGARAATPHAGAHIHFDNAGSPAHWPDGSAPETYPPIYAAVDGTVDRIDTYFPVGSNYRYGIDLAFAKSGDSKIVLSYSIEPMTNPNNSNRYSPFIKVQSGQKVAKGQIIAYMYLPEGSGLGSHIHFNLQSDQKALAPAIFTSTVVNDFKSHFGNFGWDANPPVDPLTDTELPACMGYKLNADENPFGTGEVDCL